MDFPRRVNFSVKRKSLTPHHAQEILLPQFSFYFCNLAVLGLAVLKDTYKNQVSAWDQLAEKNIEMEKCSFTIKFKSLLLHCLLHFSFYNSAFIILTRTPVNSQDANLKLTRMVAKIPKAQILLTD